nr:E3 ubiquitin-protein ligase MARCHF2-like [Dermacentor andersoni]
MANQLFQVYAEAPESNAERVCRICLRGEACTDDPLLEPCACRGPSGFAHKGCLERWLRDRDTDQCDVCHRRFMVLLKMAPLLDFFTDPSHRVDVLRMVVDAVSAAGDALVLSFAWMYASGFLRAAGWILYLLVMSVLLFQTVFWTVVEVIRVMYVMG